VRCRKIVSAKGNGAYEETVRIWALGGHCTTRDFECVGRDLRSWGLLYRGTVHLGSVDPPIYRETSISPSAGEVTTFSTPPRSLHLQVERTLVAPFTPSRSCCQKYFASATNIDKDDSPTRSHKTYTSEEEAIHREEGTSRTP
jgi:hypothetical protein